MGRTAWMGANNPALLVEDAPALLKNIGRHARYDAARARKIELENRSLARRLENCRPGMRHGAFRRAERVLRRVAAAPRPATRTFRDAPGPRTIRRAESPLMN